MNGNSNIVFHIARCMAKDFHQGDHVGDFDKNEVREVRWFSAGEIRRMIEDGAIRDGFSLVGLPWALADL